MPRPVKWRKVCCMPESNQFGPLDMEAESRGSIKMTIDEYETIRLIDLEQFTQEECAAHMNVARTTVQDLQRSQKASLNLVNGKVLFIEGGEYRLCDGSESKCGHLGCKRRNHGDS